MNRRTFFGLVGGFVAALFMPKPALNETQSYVIGGKSLAIPDDDAGGYIVPPEYRDKLLAAFSTSKVTRINLSEL